MRTGAIPFKFDISQVLSALALRPDARVSSVQLNLPFISVLAHPSAREVQLAHELFLRVRDRRVLNGRECCDGCIDAALGSLQEIRSALVEVQVNLIGEKDGILHTLIDLMLVSIRQFLTFAQSISNNGLDALRGTGEFYRPHDTRQIYFDALEQLRGHLSRSLGQLAVIAGLQIPSDGIFADYQGPWNLNAYQPPPTSMQLVSPGGG